jgi:hypothetical protein
MTRNELLIVYFVVQQYWYRKFWFFVSAVKPKQVPEGNMELLITYKNKNRNKINYALEKIWPGTDIISPAQTKRKEADELVWMNVEGFISV